MFLPSRVVVGPLASDALLESIRGALRSGPRSTEVLALLAGLLAFILLLLIVWRVFNRERPAAEPRVDYLTLAVDLLGLSESDRRDLQRIARRAGLDSPAAMLLSPENLTRAVQLALPAENDPALHERLDDLCRRLFDVPLPQVPADQPKI